MLYPLPHVADTWCWQAMSAPSTGGNTYLKALTSAPAAGSAANGAAAGSSNARKQVAHILSVQIDTCAMETVT